MLSHRRGSKIGFRQELSNMMTFQNERMASRRRTKLDVIKMPPSMAPMYEIKVAKSYWFSTLLFVCPRYQLWFILVSSRCLSLQHSNKATQPGEKDYFQLIEISSHFRSVPGTYKGIDSTNIKLEFEDVSILEHFQTITKSIISEMSAWVEPKNFEGLKIDEMFIEMLVSIQNVK